MDDIEFIKVAKTDIVKLMKSSRNNEEKEWIPAERVPVMPTLLKLKL
jgi:hypothetical protein